MAKNEKSTSYIGEDVYKKFQSFITESLDALVSRFGEEDELLTFYAQSWSKFVVSSRLFSNLFAYIDKHFVSREKFENRKEILSIQELCLKLWEKKIVSKLYDSLSAVFLRKIEENRQGQGIDILSMKLFTDSLETISRYSQFEPIYLSQTEEFFKKELAQVLQPLPKDLMVKKIYEKINEEENRVSILLPSSSFKKVFFLLYCRWPIYSLMCLLLRIPNSFPIFSHNIWRAEKRKVCK